MKINKNALQSRSLLKWIKIYDGFERYFLKLDIFNYLIYNREIDINEVFNLTIHISLHSVQTEDRSDAYMLSKYHSRLRFATCMRNSCETIRYL